jgi:hypothetical protein
MNRRVTAALLVGVLGATPVFAQRPFCPMPFRNLVLSESGAHGDEMAKLICDADSALQSARHVQGIRAGFAVFRAEAVDAVEGGLEAEKTVEALLRLVVSDRVTHEEAARVIVKAAQIHSTTSGTRMAEGIIIPYGTPYSQSWLSRAGRPTANRGDIIEAALAYNAMTTGIDFLPGYGYGLTHLVLDQDAILGMGAVVMTATGRQIEGDVIEGIARGARWVELKGAYPPDMPYRLDQLERMYGAVLNGDVSEYVVAIEAGTLPHPDWLAQLALDNADLIRQGLAPIRVGTAGGF